MVQPDSLALVSFTSGTGDFLTGESSSYKDVLVQSVLTFQLLLCFALNLT